MDALIIAYVHALHAYILLRQAVHFTFHQEPCRWWAPGYTWFTGVIVTRSHFESSYSDKTLIDEVRCKFLSRQSNVSKFSQEECPVQFSTFSNSLKIHQVRTKESQPWRRFGYPVLISIDFDDFPSPFTPYFFALIEKIFQTLETVFHWLSKHLEFRQKYSAARRIFNSLLFSISRWNTVSRVWYITSNVQSNSSIDHKTR